MTWLIYAMDQVWTLDKSPFPFWAPVSSSAKWREIFIAAPERADPAVPAQRPASGRDKLCGAAHTAALPVGPGRGWTSALLLPNLFSAGLCWVGLPACPFLLAVASFVCVCVFLCIWYAHLIFVSRGKKYKNQAVNDVLGKTSELSQSSLSLRSTVTILPVAEIKKWTAVPSGRRLGVCLTVQGDASFIPGLGRSCRLWNN